MSADPATYDGMTIYRGLTFTKVFTCKNSGGGLVDLTGWSAEFKARTSVGASTNVIDLNSDPGLVLGGAAGTITILVDAATTGAITDTELVYSLKITNGSEVDGLLVGVIPVSDKAI